jgi:hypothetical protein
VRENAIDWAGAAVRDGTLSVGFASAPSKKWSRRFRSVLALLDPSPAEWQAVTLRRGTITVPDVREGSEERLHHLLESAVVEVNGDLDGGDAPAQPERDAHRARDMRMTLAFQRLGGAEPE